MPLRLRLRARLAEEGAFKALAESGIAYQAEIAATMKVVEAELSRLSHSLSAVETMLKEVE